MSGDPTRADFLEPADLARLQAERWAAQRAGLAERSPFLRRLWAGKLPPADLRDLAALPTCDKAMLRSSQRRAPPLGDYLAAPETLVARLHRTSGTTGVAMNLALSAEDARWTAIAGARAQRAAGLGPGHRVIHCLNYRLWIGGFTDHTTLEATGATVIPFGVGASEDLVRTIRELGVSAISCTPSYPAVLEQVIEERFPGLRPIDLGLRLGLFGGEPGLDDPAFRTRLEARWGLRARNSNYGVSDVLCNFAGQCEAQTELHLVAPDILWPELVGAESPDPLPWRAGTTGELVLTHLRRDCQPLVRFRTGDLVTLTATERCACGRTAARIRVVGRVDDMVVVRGVNVFPTALQAVLGGFGALSGEWRIVLAGPPPYDRLPVEAELAAGVAPEPGLAAAIEASIKRALGASATVTLLGWRSLPRSEGKTRRVVRPEER